MGIIQSDHEVALLSPILFTFMLHHATHAIVHRKFKQREKQRTSKHNYGHKTINDKSASTLRFILQAIPEDKLIGRGEGVGDVSDLVRGGAAWDHMIT